MNIKQAVVLCALPNLMSQPFIQGGKNFEGNKSAVDCLDSVDQYIEHVLGLQVVAKWLFGDTYMYDYVNLMRAFHDRGWKYVTCPAFPDINTKTGKGRLVSSSDEILLDTCKIFMGASICQHFVFISDDADFIPTMLDCVAQGHSVTLFVSGRFTHVVYAQRLQRLKEQGIDVIKILEFFQTPETEHGKNKDVEVVPVKPEPVEKESPQVSAVEPAAMSEWIVSKPLVSPLERFNRRYKKA